MSDENQPEVKTKQHFREKTWIQMTKESRISFARRLYNRIPYFKGAEEAAQRLSQLDEFKKAKLIMIRPDKPQESIIIMSLQNEKEVLLPRPRLRSRLLMHIKNAVGLPEEEIKSAVTKQDIKLIESRVFYDTLDIKVDMIVLGSICVNKAGFRIGEGEGFADLEYAILAKMKAVNKNTVIVTTVHDCQVYSETDLPRDIFEPHDIPVDIIVTPTQTYVVNDVLSRPNNILWPLISQRKLASIPILKYIKESEEKEGKIISLNEDDSDVKSGVQEKLRVDKEMNSFYPKLKRKKLVNNSILKETDKNKEIRRRPFPRKRKFQKSKNNAENNEARDETENQENAKPKPQRQSRSNVPRNHVDFSLRLSNIASTVRVRDLKSALLERGVKPTYISWRGQRGFCYLHFCKLRKKNNVEDQPIQVDSIVANLQQLKIGEAAITNESSFIIVEPAEPVTRIEVTDVSAV